MIKLGKTVFILPNLFTASSIFCGLYSIVISSTADEPNAYWRSAIAIFFAILFDMVDGRIARLTRTQSDFGIQFDSLADFVSFGVAPGLLVYRWSLERLGDVGLFLAFLFAACGAIRLARFNVLAKRSIKSDFFIGLPIPAAAGMVISIVMAHHRAGGGEVLRNVSMALLVMILSYLMISNVRYRSFKSLKMTPKTSLLLLAILTSIVFGTYAFRMKATLALVCLFSAYVTLGLVEEVVRYGSQKLRARRVREGMAGIIPRTRFRS